MIFAQEYVHLINNHWQALMPGLPLLESYLCIPFKDIGEEGNLIDVGQHDDDFK